MCRTNAALSAVCSGTQTFVETLDQLNGTPEVSLALTKANEEISAMYEPWFARALAKSNEVCEIAAIILLCLSQGCI